MQQLGYIEGRFWVRLISSDAFAQYMEHRGFKVRSLAAAVEAELRKSGRKGKDATCSPSTIGHLRSGIRNSCRPHRARAIEKVLGAPPGSLFLPQVLHVVRDNAA
ncbi:hypothetical protein KI427_16800 [Rhodococcus ruber]|uniref:hypothetical protein n=1 Tax=Rhodococcus ruber TaxID=1830 RepID=UPI000743C599|nr:hypothetical protein [Rhodococcus ruber]UQB71276.1 hypothetical protein KI427_16800 [Rhodococcus ruber]